MEWNQFRNLNYIEKKSSSSKSAVILFHGYGADAPDLVSLASDAYGAIDWFFPQGVLEVPIGPMMTGRGWFSIANRNWEALQRGEISDSPFTPAIHSTLGLAVEFLNFIGDQYERVVIGGFSQGAILTSHAFYRTNFAAKGIVMMSGYLVSPSEFQVLSSEHQGVPFFQSHGRQDEVLPLAGAKKLRHQMNALGLKGDLQVFEGSHEIPVEIQKMVGKFIKNRLAQPEKAQGDRAK